MTKLHVIILTYNESQHLERCINSVHGFCDSILVVDSGSKDGTVEIAKSLGAEVVQNAWVNYAKQFQFGIDLLAGRGGWVLRLDADEVVSFPDRAGFREIISGVATEVDGILVKRRIYFLGKRIKHGAIEPSWQLRLFKNGSGKCEQRWMDEHISVEGNVQKSNIVISDINLNSITWWIEKHNTYASREAIDVLNNKYGFIVTDTLFEQRASSQAKVRRFLKENVYRRLPSGLRAWMYFLYRFILRLGFLDGSAGFFYHSLQGLWYRTLVDAKIREIEDFALSQDMSISDAIQNRTGIDPLG